MLADGERHPSTRKSPENGQRFGRLSGVKLVNIHPCACGWLCLGFGARFGDMATNTVVTVFDSVVNLEGKIFVWFTDKHLSGWGGADGRTHKQVIICEDWQTADKIHDNLKYDKRHGARYVNIGRKLPYLGKYSVSYRLAEDCPAWSK